MAAEQKSPSSMLFGVAMGLVTACIGGSGVAWVLKTRIASRATEWRLAPVVVAAVDIDPGTTITFDLISQRSMPRRFFTDSMVRPNDASVVVNEVTHVPIKAGETLLWSGFAAPDCEAALEAVIKERPPSAELTRLLTQLRAQHARIAPPAGPGPGPWP